MLSLKTELSALVQDFYTGSTEDWCKERFNKSVSELTEDELGEALFMAKDEAERKRKEYNQLTEVSNV